MRRAIDSHQFSCYTESSFESAGSNQKPGGFDSSHNSQAVDDHSSSSFSLKQTLPEAEYFGGKDVCFRGIAESAELANPGDLVVYRIGETDPNQLIADAMARGASGLLTEQVLPCPLPQCIVGDVELAMASVASQLLESPDLSMLTIGVVGSAGKTSTALLISSVLRDQGIRTGYQTSLGESDGIVQTTSRQKMPSGESLIHWISEAKDALCNVCVMELDENNAKHGMYESVQFDILVVTGAERKSDDYGPTSLQCVLDQLKPKGVVVASSDHPKSIRVIRDAGQRVVTYGTKKAGEVSVKTIDQSGGMTTLMFTQEDTTSLMETPLCGSAMAANHAAAAATGLLLDIPIHQVTQSLSKLRKIPGRVDRLADISLADVVVDICGAPARAASVMRTARSMKSGGQLWCILAIGENETSDELAQYGAHLERYATKAVVTCVSSMKSRFLKASHQVLDGVQHCAAMRLVGDHRRAIEWAIQEARPADTILVLGGGSKESAHDDRSQVAQIQTWVQQARERCDQPAVATVGTDEAKAKTFSILDYNS